MRLRRRVTTSDIAREAGVSRATVSYVLNETPNSGIPEDTALRIRATAQRLGYIPSSAARMLRSGRSNLVLGILPSWDLGPTYPQIFRGVGERLERHGYDFVLHSGTAPEARINQLLLSITPALVVSLQELPVSERAQLDAAGIMSYHMNLSAFVGLAGRTQTNHLIGQGFDRLAYVLPDHFIPDALIAPRIEAMRTIAKTRGLPEPRVLRLPYTAEGIAWLDREHLTGANAANAICAHTDEVAAFVFTMLGKERFGAGRMGVMGVGDRPISNVGITTVKLDIDKWAELWARPIHRILGVQPETAVSSEDHSMQIVVRASA